MKERALEKEITSSVIKVSGEEMSLDELQSVCGASVYGKELIGRVRFEGYFKPHDISNSLWEEYLGKHANNFYHMNQTRGEALEFVSGLDGTDQELNNSEKKLILTVAQLHDMGEAEVGDKPFPDKTDKDHEEEMTVLSQILNDVLYDEVDCVHRLDLIKKIQEVLSDKSTKLGRAFNAIEVIGYVKTSLIAWDKLDGDESDMQSSLRVLSHRVLASHLPELIKFAEIYPPVRSFLSTNNDKISEILYETSLFQTYERERIDFTINSWEDFKTSAIS